MAHPLRPHGETPDRIAIAGDWHGDTDWALRMIELAQRQAVDTILHLGDFGFWQFTGDYLDALDRQLRCDEVTLLWIDGNHDDHGSIDRLHNDLSGLHPIRQHIWHIPRGFRWRWLGKTWLALGGAASVNRKSLVPGATWFPQELITWRDIEAACAGGRADVMLTHDCPAGVDIPVLRHPTTQWPPTDVATATHNRHALRIVVDEVRPQVLFHGHYHDRYSAKLVANEYVTAIEGLDCNHAKRDADNMLIMDLDDVL